MTPSPIGEQGQDTKRLLMTVGIISLLFIVWKVILPAPPPPEKKPDAVAQTNVDGTPTTTPTGNTSTSSPNAANNPAPAKKEVPALVVGSTPDVVVEKTHSVKIPIKDAPGQVHAVLEGNVEVNLSNQGGQLSQWLLTGYKETSKIDPKTKKPFKLEEAPLVNLVTEGHRTGSFAGAHLFAIKSRGGDVPLSANAGYELKKADDKSVVYTRLTKSGVRITRTYSFTPGSFVVDHAVELSNEGPQKATVELDLLITSAELEGTRGGGMFAAASDELTGVCRGEDQETWKISELEDAKKEGKPTAVVGKTSYAGIDRHYFLTAVLPKDSNTISGCNAAVWTETTGAKKTISPSVIGEAILRTGVDVTLSHQPVSLAPGDKHVFNHRIFMGPKQIDLLGSVDQVLEENVDFGIFGILSKPILYVLMKIYGVVGNFAIAIILLTLLIKILTFPLNQKSYVSMQAMKTLAPELKELQKKYGHDRTLMGQKQMEMYKEKGVSPMAGCLPMLVQMPIWFALYRTLWSSVELFQKPGFLWINDLSVPDPSPLGFAFLPFIVGALMLGQTMFQPPPQDQPQMKYVMWGMPIMFTFFMFGMPSGLSIYMITNSILTMAQQYYIKRKYPVPDVVTESDAASSKKKK